MRKYMDADQAAAGRSAARADWIAGTVRTNLDVFSWEHSSYGLAYCEQIAALKAEHSSEGRTA